MTMSPKSVLFRKEQLNSAGKPYARVQLFFSDQEIHPFTHHTHISSATNSVHPIHLTPTQLIDHKGHRPMARGQAEKHKHCTPRSWTEQDLSAALDTICSGSSVRAAALKWKIPVQTLCDQSSGKTKLYQLAHGLQQRLSPEGEMVLVAWVQLWADTARPVSIPWTQQIACDLAGGKVGKNWVYRFLKQYPELKHGKPSGLDLK